MGLAIVVEVAVRLARRAGRAADWSAYGEDPDENWAKYMTGLWTSAAITRPPSAVARPHEATLL